MMPCRTNRKSLALLAMDLVDCSEAQKLREHLEACEGCRAYLAELTRVAAMLEGTRVAEPQPSPFFHRRVAGAIRSEAAKRNRGRFLAWLKSGRTRWGRMVPVAGAGALALALAAVLLWPKAHGPTYSAANSNATSVGTAAELAPTLANYQATANRSLDELDELLTRQAEQTPPALPLYTASLSTRFGASD